MGEITFDHHPPERDQHIGGRLSRGLIYEPEETRLFLHFLRPHTNFFDVGANIGWYSCLALAAEPTCRVFAFEAEHSNYELLKRNLNRANKGRWEAVHGAVTEKCHDGSVVMYRHPTSGGHARWRRSGAGEKFVVPAVSLNTYEEWRPLGIIKVDTEGGVAKAMSGADQWVLDDRPVAFLEFWPEGERQCGWGPMSALGWLQGGYTAFGIADGYSGARLLDLEARSGKFPCAKLSYDELDQFSRRTGAVKANLVLVPDERVHLLC